MKQIIRACTDTGNGPRYKEITGYVHPALPGLAVARACFTSDSGWILSHTGTGLRCGTMKDKREAILVLEQLIPAGIDWTLDRDNLLRAYPRLHLRQTVEKAIEAARLGRPRQKFLFPA